ncbi:MAG TPA: dihydrolipoamide acetyltransferase family protein [Thermoleophilaceae bacterium]|nr:dihydrolipoamide acetyltransferase family protein [Thermoleophilaceae bacterium]
MASDVVMPRLSDSMEEGTVLKWLIDEGGEVKRGEPLVEIETDKANMTYDSDTDGVLIEIVAEEGDTLPIGEVIARIGEAGEAKGSGKPAQEEKPAAGDSGEEAKPESDASQSAPAVEESPERDEREPAIASAEEGAEREEREPAVASAQAGGGETESGAGTATKASPSAGNGDGRVKASPVARRMARELGVELAALEGSGPGGRIVKADVQAAAGNGGAQAEAAAPPAAEPAAAEPAAPDQPSEERAAQPDAREALPQPARAEAGAKGQAEVLELTRLQQTVSRRMAESKATAPDFSISLTVDMTKAVELRARLKEVTDPAPSFNDMVVKAAATALREHPRVNGAYRDGKFELYENVNIGVAVAAMDALVVPTIFDADKKSLGQISKDARAVIERVRDKTVTPPELSGGTFTVSNLGMFGIELFTAIINPPQASILTVGALAKKPAVDASGRIVAQDQMTLSLVCDHRILYGADGAKFLARIKELLEQPLSLAL